MPVEKNIYSKILNIMNEVEKIPKRGVFEGKSYSYKYVIGDDVFAEIRPLLVKNKLIIIPEAKEMVVNTENKITEVSMIFHIIDTETEKEITLEWQGTGFDMGEKGIYKAYTLAEKYFLAKLFFIPLGDANDESKEHTGKQKPPQSDSDEEKIRIRNLQAIYDMLMEIAGNDKTIAEGILAKLTEYNGKHDTFTTIKKKPFKAVYAIMKKVEQEFDEYNTK